MHFFPGNILAALLRQQDAEFIPDIQHSLLLSLVNSDYRAFSSVYLHIAFLFQHGICLIHRMHINTNGVGKLSHTGKYIPLMKTVGSDSQNDLVPQLNIQCLITAEINLYIHIQYASLFFLCFFCYIYSITVSTSCQPFSSDAGACRSSLFQSIPYKDYGKKPTENWSIETFWSDEEKESLGIKEKDNIMSLDEFNGYISSLIDDIKDYQEAIKCLNMDMS